MLTKEAATDRAAVIVGAGRGIGRAVAHRLAREGCDLVLVDVVESRVRAVAAEIRESGLSATGMSVDVSRPPLVGELGDQIATGHPKVHILVNCAAFVVRKPPDEMTDDEYERVVSVTLGGTWHVVRRILPLLRAAASEGACVVNIGSSAVHHAVPNRAAYTASKGGVLSLTRALALDLARDGIRVNAVTPGVTNTGLVAEAADLEQIEQFVASSPLGRLVEPEEIAGAVAFLASPEASAITGAELVVDGGSSVGTTWG